MTYDCECSECGKPFLSEYPNIEMCPKCAEEMIVSMRLFRIPQYDPPVPTWDEMGGLSNLSGE